MLSLDDAVEATALYIKTKGKEVEEDLLKKIAQVYETKGLAIAKVFAFAESPREMKNFFAQIFNYIENVEKIDKSRLVGATIIRGINGIINYY